MPTSWATMSSSRSRVNVSAAHGPRYATYCALFVTRRAEREAERFHLVGARQHRLDEPADHGAHAGVRAGVDGHVDLHAEHVALVGHRGLGDHALLARLARGHQVLAAILDPLHRAAEVA